MLRCHEHEMTIPETGCPSTAHQLGRSIRSGVILLVPVLLAFAGCMIGPDYQPPKVSVSPNWGETGDQRVSTESTTNRGWWRTFNDPVLDRLVAQAYRDNLPLRQAGVRVLQARAQLGIAVGEIFPQAQQPIGSVEYNRTSDRAATAAAFNGTVAYWQSQIGAQANWELDFWGRIRRGIESADASLLATLADYDSTLVTLTADVANTYIALRSAEMRAVAQSAQIGVAKSDLLPAFSLIGNLVLVSTDLGTFRLSDMFRWGSRQVQIGPSVQWNILNYGQITNNVRVQDANFQQLLLAYQRSVLSAQQDVEDNLAAFLRSQDRADLLAKSVTSSRNAVDLAVLQYREGVTDFTTVLTTQQTLLSQQDSLASTLGNISTSLVGVYRALGGGWETREGDDIVPPEIKTEKQERTNWGR